MVPQPRDQRKKNFLAPLDCPATQSSNILFSAKESSFLCQLKSETACLFSYYIATVRSLERLTKIQQSRERERVLLNGDL